MFPATGIRLPELAGNRYDPGDPRRSDIDLWHREITVHGKDRATRTVKIGYDAARSPRPLPPGARPVRSGLSPQLWLGVSNRGPMTASGIYQVIARRGRQCGVDVLPHRFRHHFSHTWLDRGGPEGDLMELNGWTSPQMLRRYGASARSAGPAGPTTASWPTCPDPSPPGLPPQGPAPRAHPIQAKYPPFCTGTISSVPFARGAQNGIFCRVGYLLANARRSLAARNYSALSRRI